jgi:hypothetical protein
MLSSVCDEAFSGINTRDRGGLRLLQYRFRERARAATGIEPMATRRHSKPIKEFSSD